MTEAELKKLGARAGGIRELVAPTRREEAAKVADGKLAAWLAEDPKRLRRPIIDTGSELLVGFTKAVRDRLSSNR